MTSHLVAHKEVSPIAGTKFRDESFFPEMIVAPAGNCWVGATEDDKFASAIEKPRHFVKFVRPFGVGICPVTFAQWDAFSADNSSAHEPADLGWGRGRMPVVNVSWEDAQLYVSWLKEKSGRRYRLLSETEWEYCCRAGTSGVFVGGPEITVKDANFLPMSLGETTGLGKPVVVGSYAPNAFGLHDMQGNVCELVEDSWHDSYTNAPNDGSAWDDPPDTIWRVVRGGGWDAMPRMLRPAFRDWVHHLQRMDNLGFRVASELD